MIIAAKLVIFMQFYHHILPIIHYVKELYAIYELGDKNQDAYKV